MVEIMIIPTNQYSSAHLENYTISRVIIYLYERYIERKIRIRCAQERVRVRREH